MMAPRFANPGQTATLAIRIVDQALSRGIPLRFAALHRWTKNPRIAACVLHVARNPIRIERTRLVYLSDPKEWRP